MHRPPSDWKRESGKEENLYRPRSEGQMVTGILPVSGKVELEKE